MADALTGGRADALLELDILISYLKKIQRFRGNLIFPSLIKYQVRLGAARVPGLRTSAFELFDLFDIFLEETQDFRGVFDFQK